MDFIQLAVATAAVVSSVVAGLAWLATRKKDDAEVKAEQRVNDFDELRSMNDVLRAGLGDAQTRTNQLNDDLKSAKLIVESTRAELEKLNRALDVALANVALLSAFIEEHVPQDVPRPLLRRMM